MTDPSFGGEQPPDRAVPEEAVSVATPSDEAGSVPAAALADGPASVPADPEGVTADPEGVTGEPDAEVVDGLPVLAEVRTIEHSSPASLPAVQAAAAAATGFVAGAATVALVKRRAARKQVLRNGRGGSRRAADLLPIAATRSFLVDVHVIAKPE